MTVKELKEKLSEFPDDMQVFIPSHETEYSCVSIEGVAQTGITYHHADETEEEMEVVKINEY